MGIIGKLDPRRVIRKIGSMVVGENGYTNPETISIVYCRRIYRVFLDLEGFFMGMENKVYKIPIKRIGSKADEYDLDIRSTRHVWVAGERSFDEPIEDGEDRKERFVELLYGKGRSGKQMQASIGKLEEDLKRAINDEKLPDISRLRERLRRLKE